MTVDLLAPREWRGTHVHPDYEVSDCGQVRRRGASRVRRLTLKYNAVQRRYTYFQVTLKTAGRTNTIGAHRLVCWAFHGPPPSSKHEVAHANGDQRDNRADNLRWATRAENTADQKLHGTFSAPPLHAGEDQHNSKLTEEDVRGIRQLAASNLTHREIADRFGVKRANVSHIVSRRSWAHVV